MTAAEPESTDQVVSVLTRHLKAVGRGKVDAIMEDYAKDAIILTQSGTVRGLDEIRGFFVDLLDQAKSFTGFKILHQAVEGELALLTWSATGRAFDLPLVAESYIIRGGKIVAQTYAVYREGDNS